MHLICPPKCCINLCFSFLPDITAVPREIENNAYAKFLGEVRYIMGNVEVVNAIVHLSLDLVSLR